MHDYMFTYIVLLPFSGVFLRFFATHHLRTTAADFLSSIF